MRRFPAVKTRKIRNISGTLTSRIISSACSTFVSIRG
jgi:hypothetical protein